MTEIPIDDSGLTVGNARRLLEQERDERLRQCNAAIAGVLQEYSCHLVAVPQLTEDGRIGASVKLAADGV